MISEPDIWPAAAPTPVTPDKVATLSVLNAVTVDNDDDVALLTVVAVALFVNDTCRFAEM